MTQVCLHLNVLVLKYGTCASTHAQADSWRYWDIAHEQRGELRPLCGGARTWQVCPGSREAAREPGKFVNRRTRATHSIEI